MVEHLVVPIRTIATNMAKANKILYRFIEFKFGCHFFS